MGKKWTQFRSTIDGELKRDQEKNLISTPSQAHKKIIWLYIPMQKGFGVHILYSVDLNNIQRAQEN